MPERDPSDADGHPHAAGEPRPARRPRRASTPPVPGSDPTPQADARVPAVRAAEDAPQGWGDAPASADTNDDRLRLDRPPHWG
ncbi:hypothetical protein AWH51_09065 [Clavibacter tessellarius]|uniref:Uncharacterized protein n=1 Tax=Clavibacter tessellarius TaxID=31965 RepID=A0A154V1N9_9MICO|nr:hypothetical protein AWH51_09065 [Clavibacter michiganensis subsp. tessellarius]